MATFRTELPLTSMNRKLIKALRNLKKRTLAEHIEHEVRAKLLTREEADEIRARLTPEELAAVPGEKKAKAGRTPPTPADAPAGPPVGEGSA